MKGFKYIFILLFASGVLAGCSTKKNTWSTRSYHQTKVKYNILYNGNIAYEEGLKAIRDANTDDYSSTLEEPMPYSEFVQHVKEVLQATYVRYTRPAKEQVQTIALCGGAGAEFIGEAMAQGADVYLTADCKYHEFQDADGRIGLIDIDHWISERHARVIFKEIIEPLGVKCFISTADHTPILVES